MHWGVATALLEQSRRRGALRGRRGLAATRGPAAPPPPARARQPLPRPARPLRRAGARWRTNGPSRSRASRAHASFALNADDPLIADLGRDADRRRRARRHLLRHRGRVARRCPSCSTPSMPSTAAAAAPPTPTSGRSSVTSGTTPAPTAVPTGRRRTSPRRRSSCTGCAGSSVHVATPEGELDLELPLPGLYNVYNALAAVAAALALGVPLERIRPALDVDARRLRPGRDDRGRRQAASRSC